MDSIYENYFRAMPWFLTVQDRELNVIDANESFVNNFGDYHGRRCYQVYKYRPEKCNQCPVERTYRDGLPHHSEELVTTLDGKSVFVIVYTTPIKDKNGQIISVMEMSTDVTEIKLLQGRLDESQEKISPLV